MPQLDITAFTTQILWLVAICYIFHFFLIYILLPDMSEAIKLRRKFCNDWLTDHEEWNDERGNREYDLDDYRFFYDTTMEQYEHAMEAVKAKKEGREPASIAYVLSGHDTVYTQVNLVKGLGLLKAAIKSIEKEIEENEKKIKS